MEEHSDQRQKESTLEMHSAVYTTELDDARKRAERVGELRRKRFEAEFEVWLAELPEEKKKQITGSMSLGSNAAKSILRAEYAKEVGFDLQGE